jgi:hypothetical protein
LFSKIKLNLIFFSFFPLVGGDNRSHYLIWCWGMLQSFYSVALGRGYFLVTSWCICSAPLGQNVSASSLSL